MCVTKIMQTFFIYDATPNQRPQPTHTIAELSGVDQEMELLKKLRHPNIVTYVDAIRTERHLHILLEYMENGAFLCIVWDIYMYRMGYIYI